MARLFVAFLCRVERVKNNEQQAEWSRLGCSSPNGVILPAALMLTHPVPRAARNAARDLIPGHADKRRSLLAFFV